jgi:hypothetical protein
MKAMVPRAADEIAPLITHTLPLDELDGALGQAPSGSISALQSV